MFTTLLLVLLGLLVLSIGLFVAFFRWGYEPGGHPSPEERQKWASLSNFRGNKFQNELPTPMNIPFRNKWNLFTELLKDTKLRSPGTQLPVVPLRFEDHEPGATLVTWFGHSAILLEIDGLTLLIDPMLGERPSPIPYTAKSRFCKDLPAQICDLPNVDAIILTHDHYDHLDYGSILQLHERTDRFLTPLGVGAHLRRWGVDPGKIEEYNWWEEARLGSLQLTCVPARHFSGRGFFDRFHTLWCGWVIRGQEDNIYFSGDSGYGPHFKTIGDRLGPFDFAMLECGQYHEDWKNIHMLPEETAQAAEDLRAKWALPVHWGAFVLALHPWNEPVERFQQAARDFEFSVITPRIGETVDVKDPQTEVEDWWREENLSLPRRRKDRGAVAG